VIGAKLSEGLNFSDDLARAVIVVGLPFANLGSPELRERMKYVNRLETKSGMQRKPGQKDAAAELYENMCMNAVNQSIGKRNIHHRDKRGLSHLLFILQVEQFDIRVTGHRSYSSTADMPPLRSATSCQNGSMKT
jgi:Rad3-related DNA helicase